LVGLCDFWVKHLRWRKMEAENDTNLLYCSKVVGNHEVSFGETKLHFVENKQ